MKLPKTAESETTRVEDSELARVFDALPRERGWTVLLATAGEIGKPHLAMADRILPGPDGLVQISGWLCPTTIRDLKENARLALVVRGGSDGVEIEGSVDEIAEDARLDDFPVGDQQVPQVRFVLHVHPERFLHFSDGLHSDEPLEG